MKRDLLFYICESCETPNFIMPDMERRMKGIKAIVCGSCFHKHSDLKDLKNFAKATGGIHE